MSKKIYEVVTTNPERYREDRGEFRHKSKALDYAEKLREQGHYKIFIDAYDVDEDGEREFVSFVSISAKNKKLDE